MKRIFELTKSNLLVILRNKSTLFSTIAFPLIFIGVFGIAFQGGSQGNTPIDIGIVVADEGIPDGSVVLYPNGSIVEGDGLQTYYLELLGNLTYSDNSTEIFDITLYNQEESDLALKSIQDSSNSAIMYFSANFSKGYMAAFRNTYQDNSALIAATGNFSNYPSSDYFTKVVIQGDQTLQEYSIASSILQSSLEQFFSFGRSSDTGLKIELDTEISAEEFSVFDYILPGLVIFGILQNVATTAAIGVRDVESGLLKRLKITQLTGFEYTTALISSQLIVSLVQVPIFFGAGMLFGFPMVIEIVYAFLIVMIMSLSVTGIGLILASFAEDTDSVGAMAAMVSVPMAFLAGAFFMVPNPTIIAEGGIFGSNNLGVLDIITATPAIEALRLVLIGGRSLTAVSFQMTLLSVLTLIYLTTGIVLYSKKHLTAT